MGRLLTLLFLFFGLMSFSCFAQYGSNENEVDSLLRLLKETTIDKERGYLFKELWRAHIDNDTKKAMNYAKGMIEIGKKIDNDTILSSGYQRLAITQAYLQDYKASRKNYLKALNIYEAKNAKSPAGMILLNIGIDFNELGVIDSTFYYYNRALAYFKESGDSLGIGDVYKGKSTVYYNQGYYSLSLENSLLAMKIFEDFEEEFSMSTTQRKISSAYEKMNDFPNAERYLMAAISYFEKAGRKRWLSSTKLELARLYTVHDMNVEDIAPLFNEGLSLAREVNFPFNINYYHYWYGVYLTNSNQLVQAKKHLLRSLRLSDSLKLKTDNTMAHIALGEVYLLEKRNDSCSYFAQLGLKKAKELNLLEEQRKAFLILSKISGVENKNEQALDYYKLHKSINDSIYNKENGQRLSELQTIYETEKKEAAITLQGEEIKTLNEKAKVDKLTKGLYAGGMASALALSGLLVFGFRQRMKKNRIAREKQEEIYKQEIAHKKKELTSQTLHLVQKNTFIQELMENLENIKNSPDKFKAEFRRIVMLLKKENASDKDWEVFKTYFADVHNDFDQKLKTLYGDITEKEIRLAAFLRMNLTTKEIAATLNVLPNSILTSKYRLKKKLGLDKDTDLNTFLNTL